jgi:hypothetical protein
VESKNTSAKPDGKTAPLEDASSGNLDKVRDILFGGQAKDIDRRFQRLEDRLLKETAELKDDIRKRLTTLEQFVKQETATLAERIKTEHDERTDATKDLARDARDTAKAFEKKTGQIDDQVGKVQRELRQQILDARQSLTDDLRQKIDDVLLRLSQESADLRTEKTDRATLAALLNEMAMRLSTDPANGSAEPKRKG